MNLTKLELSILELAYQGLSNDDIKNKLNISIENVKTNFCKIYKKFGLIKNNGSLRKQAIEKYKVYYKLDIRQIRGLVNGIIDYNNKNVICKTEIDILAKRILELLNI